MKKIILLCVAFLSAIATFAQQDANRVFVFTDKDGNAFENGATIERDKLEFDDFEEFKQILSDVYVKQTATDKSYAVSMSVKINNIDNGTLKVCFPMSCLQLVKPGTSDLGKNALSETASYNKETGLASILTEWIPKSEDAWGTCEATFTLTTLIKKSFLDYTTVGKSSEITIRFINRDPAGSNVSGAVSGAPTKGSCFNGEVAYSYYGDVTYGGNGLAKVVITDNEDGTYNIAISGMAVSTGNLQIDLGTITFKNIPGKELRGITSFSSDMEFVEGEVVGSDFNRGETKMTVDGAFKKDKCYVELAGKFQGWGDNPFRIWIGSPVEPDAFVYKVKAEITYPADATVIHDADEVRIIDNGDGTMKFIYPQFTIAESNIVVGDYSVSNVSVSEADENGFKKFTSYNSAKLANPSSFAAASGLSPELDLPTIISGRYNEKSIEMKGEFMVSGSGTAPRARFVFDSTPKPVVYTGNASSLYNGTSTDFGNVSVDVYEFDDTCIYEFVVKQVAMSSMVIGDFTITGVVGTKKSDGSISYSFEGKAKVTDVGFAASQTFGFKEGDSVNVKLNGVIKDGKLNMELVFKVGNENDVVYTFDSKQNPDKDTDISAHSDILYFDKTVGVAGNKVVLSLKMRNRLKAVAYQCDLYLPDGVEVAKNDDGSYKIDLSTERTTVENSNVFKSALQSDGCIRILSASTSNIAYNGNDGEVATIVLQLSDSLEEGDLPIILRNVEIADANSANNVIDFVKSTLTVSAYTVGDVNNDGRISITDFTAIVEYLMGNAPAVFIEKAADISGDGKISVTDLTSLVPLIMQGTNASPRHASPSMNSESAYAELSAADCFMGRGMECTVDVKVTGNYDFSAYQFDLDLPEGVRVKMLNGMPCVTLMKSSADDHLPNVFTSGIMPDGSLRVLGATTDGALVKKTDGCIARITLVADRDAAYGLHNATVGNIVLAANGHDIEPEPTAFSISVGDATGIDGIDAGEECGDIYDVAGKLVKRNGTTKGLKQGIYIMNGKKVLK